MGNLGLYLFGELVAVDLVTLPVLGVELSFGVRQCAIHRVRDAI